MAIGKWLKHKEMLQIPDLRPYLPNTYPLTPETALKMLKMYPSIFIKPNHGTHGKGIIKVKQIQKNDYEVRFGKVRKYVSSDSLYHMLKSNEKSSKQYLVQQGLELAKYKGSIFDMRLYMQKPKSQWVLSGMVARIAAPKLFVTNYHKGGQAESLPKVLLKLSKNSKSKVSRTLKTITDLSFVIAKKLSKHHARICELGIDLAIDKDGRIWIIEANSQPGHKLFTQLPDKNMLYKIRKNKRLIKENKIKQYYSYPFDESSSSSSFSDDW